MLEQPKEVSKRVPKKYLKKEEAIEPKVAEAKNEETEQQKEIQEP